MKKMTYLERLTQTQEQKDQQQLGFIVQQNKLQAEQDLLETQRLLASEKVLLEKLKSSPQLSLSKIIQQQGVVEGYEKGLELAQAVVAELFG